MGFVEFVLRVNVFFVELLWGVWVFILTKRVWGSD